MKIARHLWVLVILIGLIIVNCREEAVFTNNPNDQPRFSLDTLRFDTVFTERGSVTRSFKIYNPHSQSLAIEKVSYRGGAEGKFRMNIDGFQGPEITDIEIAPKDSTYAFIEITIDPDLPVSESPFIIEDALVFETNGVQKLVFLEAWGQNANYIPGVNQNNAISLLSCNNQTVVWDDPKPYVIFGALIIDSCGLEISAGTRIFVHGGFGQVDDLIFNGGIVLVERSGVIRSLGEPDLPVEWSTDRLEESFQDDPGQWSGIRILSGSKGNVFRSNIIRNSIIGIEVDSSANLILDKTAIHTTAGTGLIGVHANISALNCLFANNGTSSFEALHGGDYLFDHCTFANFGTDRPALSLANFRCLDVPSCSNVLVNDLDFKAVNCIVTGSLDDEISLSNIDVLSGQSSGVEFSYNFDHCIVAVDEITEDYPDFFDHCNSCFEWERNQALFINIDNINYDLDSLSVAQNRGLKSGVSDDLLGRSRDSEPDLGCYERQD